LFGFVWLCLALFGFVWFCLALFGFVWFCLALFGFVWFCLALFGFVGLLLLTYSQLSMRGFTYPNTVSNISFLFNILILEQIKSYLLLYIFNLLLIYLKLSLSIVQSFNP